MRSATMWLKWQTIHQHMAFSWSVTEYVNGSLTRRVLPLDSKGQAIRPMSN